MNYFKKQGEIKWHFSYPTRYYIPSAIRNTIGSDGYVESTLLLSAIFAVIQAIQLPVFIKLGYTKAKILSILPFAILMALQNISTILADFLGKLSGSGMIAPLLVAMLVIIVISSYGLSVVFYMRREF